MIIILEGENKCGKTTLAKKIIKEYNAKYFKCSQPKGNAFNEYDDLLNEIENLLYNDKEDYTFVIDRFYIGEDVYGPIYRGKSDLSIKQRKIIEDKLIKLNTKIIYCTDSAENIRKRFRSEKEEFADENLIEETLDLYEKSLSKVDYRINIFEHIMKTDKDLTIKGLDKICNQ